MRDVREASAQMIAETACCTSHLKQSGKDGSARGRRGRANQTLSHRQRESEIRPFPGWDGSHGFSFGTSQQQMPNHLHALCDEDDGGRIAVRP